MKNEVFEKAFREVREFVKAKDRRTRQAKREIDIAKQEFLAEVQEQAEHWFDNKIKEFRP